MTLESQVVSLPLAKRLKELGVKQESIFFHRGVSNNTRPEPENWFYSWSILPSVQAMIENARTQIYAAFTVAELGDMLPKQRYWTSICLDTHRWRFAEFDEDGLAEDNRTSFVADTEADARAAMLIYLLENNLMTV